MEVCAHKIGRDPPRAKEGSDDDELLVQYRSGCGDAFGVGAPGLVA